MIVNLLLLLVPLSVVLEYVVHAPPVWVFAIGVLAIVPLAEWIRRATEHLATRANTMRLALRQHGLFDAALAVELQPETVARDRGRLATMGRLASGNAALDIARLRLRDWLDAAVGSARLAMPEQAPALIVSMPAETLELDADRELLTTALSDALVDAAHARPQQSAIELHALHADAQVKIDVPGRDSSSALALLSCAVLAHGGEVLTLADGMRLRLCLPLAGPR